MKNPVSKTKRPVDRRSFMKSGLLAGGAATVGAGLLAKGTSASAQERGGLNAGDIAILRFLAAAELSNQISGHNMQNWGALATISPSK